MNSNHYQLFTILIGFRTASPTQHILQTFANIGNVTAIVFINKYTTKLNSLLDNG